MERKLTANVIDLDHYRIRGGMAVETDYIIRVEPTEGTQIESFTISKTYSSFRTLGNQLKKIADNAMATTKTVDESTKKLAQYCETVHHLVETQRLQYLGKVRLLYCPPWGAIVVCQFVHIGSNFQMPLFSFSFSWFGLLISFINHACCSCK